MIHSHFDGKLDRLIEQAAPGKLIRIELAQPVADQVLARYGELQSREGLRAELRVPRAETGTVAARLLHELPIADVTIEDPPIPFLPGRSRARRWLCLAWARPTSSQCTATRGAAGWRSCPLVDWRRRWPPSSARCSKNIGVSA
ncbi:hypothetical protein [Kallotenue papyrolyticum]|uniref:hypothetical protein n=1 Tax=Kallotenue papyrolyticum TaxID=1325125 RepID=UPI0004929116|nr:hypothetical protein [Kallotenue papyrolyticum]